MTMASGGLTDWGFPCIVLGMAKWVRITTFENRDEAIAYADELYRAWLLKEQIRKAMEAGWISLN